MGNWYILLFVIFAIFGLWYVSVIVKRNPESFSKSNFLKSSSTLGVLGLVLIAFVAFCVLLLRQG